MLERLWYLLLATAGLFIITIHGSLLENDANESPPTCDFDLAVDVAEALRYSPQGLDYGTLTWIHNTDGGYYNPKQEFRTENPNDPNSLVGVFAKERIEIGELLCRVPSTHWITGITNESEHSQLCCDMVRKLALNMKLGNESKFSPYIRYLNEQPENQIPSVWSTQAQDLLLQVMGQTRDENNQSGEKSAMFPPSKVAAWIEEGWYGRCQGNHHDDVERKAALMALLRADDEIMIPAYDFVSLVA